MLALPAVIIFSVWKTVGYNMIIYLAGLQAIPAQFYEAATIDGAGPISRFWRITVPLLAPTTTFILIYNSILAFQVFAVVIVLSGGDVVTVLANETYRQYYDLQNFNVAAAYASFILLLSMITSLFYLRAVRGQEEAAV